MSLNVESSKSGRSRSRNRGSDGPPSLSDPKAKSSKPKRRVTIADDLDDRDSPPESRHGAEPIYEIRSPPKTTPGLSSLAADLPPITLPESDNESDRHHRRSHRRHDSDDLDLDLDGDYVHDKYGPPAKDIKSSRRHRDSEESDEDEHMRNKYKPPAKDLNTSRRSYDSDDLDLDDDHVHDMYKPPVKNSKTSRRRRDSKESDRDDDRIHEMYKPSAKGSQAMEMPSFAKIPGFDGAFPMSSSPVRAHGAAYPTGSLQYPSGGGLTMPSADFGMMPEFAHSSGAPTTAKYGSPPEREREHWPDREHRHDREHRDERRDDRDHRPARSSTFSHSGLGKSPPARSSTMPYPSGMPSVLPITTPGGRDSMLGADTKYSVRSPPTGGLSVGMDRLSVGGGKHASGGGLPPPSPLLEAYKGTYQSISPLPSPITSPITGFDDVEPLVLSSSPQESFREDKAKRRARIYDSEADAKDIYEALTHRRHVDPEPLIRILPELTHDQTLELRDTYRKTYKASGTRIDMTKHIKMATEGSFGKLCFVTASGRWKSEAYWSNCWYQSHAASRELLIESLMGRTNAEIREIKKAFRDKKYDDDLDRCMRRELKADKFRDAVLLVLAEERQEETDAWPAEYRDRDADVLYRALTAPQGGESAMLKIVCSRSDKHLREVLKVYEQAHGSSFAKDALKKSNNLVGEVIAHILNGAINRPARDALLLRHAITDLHKAHELRYELLMSRLVRLHWDARHFGQVKHEYKAKYRRSIDDEIRAATRGEFGEFCVRLCET